MSNATLAKAIEGLLARTRFGLDEHELKTLNILLDEAEDRGL